MDREGLPKNTATPSRVAFELKNPAARAGIMLAKIKQFSSHHKFSREAANAYGEDDRSRS